MKHKLRFVLGTTSLILLAELSVGVSARAQSYSFANVADTSNAAFKTFDLSPSINASGTVAFAVTLSDNTPAIYLGSATSASVRLTTPDEGFTFLLEAPSISSNGTVAFFGMPNDNDSGVYSISNGGMLQTIATTNGGAYESLGAPQINTGGSIAYPGSTSPTGEPSSIFLDGAAVVAEGGMFSRLGVLSLGDGNVLAFQADVASGGSGIFVFQNGNSSPVAQVDSTFASFGTRVAVNQNQTVAFLANLQGGGRAIYSGKPGTSPTQLGTTVGGAFTNFAFPSINASGEVAFLADLPGGGHGIYTGPNRVADKVIATGDTLFGSSLSQITTSGESLNDTGQIVFVYELENGRSGVAIATPSNGVAEKTLGNISTRLMVGSGENVLIGGFIVVGSTNKRVIVRAIGPSLAGSGITGALANPTLELHAGDGSLLASNDNWRDTQSTEIQGTGVAPTDELESAIVQSLAPGNYTAIIRGKDNATGVGLVEAYDLEQAANSRLGNISTRGFVDTGDTVLIGGFIVGPNTKVIVRAIGPTLGSSGVAGALQDPTLEVRNGNGALLAANDNWKTTQQSEIEATGVPPRDDREAAIVQTLGAGNYTAIVRGKSNATGVGLVEVYNLP